jgi:hypothetical protein
MFSYLLRDHVVDRHLSRRCMPERFGSISFLGPSSPSPKSHKRRSNKHVAMPTFLTLSNHYPSSYFYRACRALTDVKIPAVLTLKLGVKVLNYRAVRSVCSTRCDDVKSC